MEEIMKRQVANYIVERVDDKVVMRTVSGKWSVSVDAFSMRGAFLIECLIAVLTTSWSVLSDIRM